MFETIRLASVARPGAIVLGKFQDRDVDVSTLGDGEGRAAVTAAVGRAEFSGAVGSVAEAFVGRSGGAGKGKGRGAASGAQRVLVVGLGKSKGSAGGGFKLTDLREATAAATRRLAGAKETSVVIDFGPALGQLGRAVDQRLAGRAVGEALGLLSWNAVAFKGSATDKAKKERRPLTVDAGGGRFKEGVELGLGLAESTNFARTLSETPPNIATPDWMAQQARALARSTGLECTVLRGGDLVNQKLVGHMNVGRASENKPCFIRLAYSPGRGSGSAKPVVLVGKTLTYDTGGLSLKVNNGMVGMKRDKDGGCAVLGAMHAIAKVIKPRVPVVALLCAAENSVSDNAFRPDDVITYRNGVTVEITNTDAEGRLVLADGLCWACEKENPAAIIDLATLTGGVVVALGSTYCGMFCEDRRLRERIEAASASSGERVWRLPMHAEYRDMMKSPIADILNSNPNRKAHPVQGAAFLSYFVEGYPDKGVPWCHLDIAGVHAIESDGGCFVKGPAGWGVRLLADVLAKW
ncbi:MAG: M17 family metallopeptidase [Phycisphaerales bacterium]